MTTQSELSEGLDGWSSFEEVADGIRGSYNEYGFESINEFASFLNQWVEDEEDMKQATKLLEQEEPKCPEPECDGEIKKLYWTDKEEADYHEDADLKQEYNLAAFCPDHENESHFVYSVHQFVEK